MSISLKPTALQDAIQTKSLVLFHAPWCGHCKSFAPVYEAYTDASGAHVTKINYDKYADDIKDFKMSDGKTLQDVVKGYPTLVAFDAGRYEKFNGPRSTSGIAAFANAFFRPAQEEELFQPDDAAQSAVVSMQPTALKDAIGSASLVLFHAPWCGHCKSFAPIYEAFAAAAKSNMPSVHVTRINYDKYANEVHQFPVENGTVGDLVSGFPTVVAFHNGRHQSYDGPRTVDGLQAFSNGFFPSALSGGGLFARLLGGESSDGGEADDKKDESSNDKVDDDVYLKLDINDLNIPPVEEYTFDQLKTLQYGLVLTYSSSNAVALRIDYKENADKPFERIKTAPLPERLLHAYTNRFRNDGSSKILDDCQDEKKWVSEFKVVKVDVDELESVENQKDDARCSILSFFPDQIFIVADGQFYHFNRMNATALSKVEFTSLYGSSTDPDIVSGNGYDPEGGKKGISWEDNHFKVKANGENRMLFQNSGDTLRLTKNEKLMNVEDEEVSSVQNMVGILVLNAAIEGILRKTFSQTIDSGCSTDIIGNASDNIIQDYYSAIDYEGYTVDVEMTDTDQENNTFWKRAGAVFPDAATYRTDVQKWTDTIIKMYYHATPGTVVYQKDGDDKQALPDLWFQPPTWDKATWYPCGDITMVYGDTKPRKEDIKKHGGVWNASLKAWIFDKDDSENIAKLGTVEELPALADAPSDTTGKLYRTSTKGVVVQGETDPHRRTLYCNGGAWHKKREGFVFRKSDFDKWNPEIQQGNSALQGGGNEIGDDKDDDKQGNSESISEISDDKKDDEISDDKAEEDGAKRIQAELSASNSEDGIDRFHPEWNGEFWSPNSSTTDDFFHALYRAYKGSKKDLLREFVEDATNGGATAFLDRGEEAFVKQMHAILGVAYEYKDLADEYRQSALFIKLGKVNGKKQRELANLMPVAKWRQFIHTMGNETGGLVSEWNSDYAFGGRFLSAIIHDISNNRMFKVPMDEYMESLPADLQGPMKESIATVQSWDPPKRSAGASTNKCTYAAAICAVQLMNEKGEPLEGKFLYQGIHSHPILFAAKKVLRRTRDLSDDEKRLLSPTGLLFRKVIAWLEERNAEALFVCPVGGMKGKTGTQEVEKGMTNSLFVNNENGLESVGDPGSYCGHETLYTHDMAFLKNKYEEKSANTAEEEEKQTDA